MTNDEELEIRCGSFHMRIVGVSSGYALVCNGVMAFGNNHFADVMAAKRSALEQLREIQGALARMAAVPGGYWIDDEVIARLEAEIQAHSERGDTGRVDQTPPN